MTDKHSINNTENPRDCPACGLSARGGVHYCLKQESPNNTVVNITNSTTLKSVPCDGNHNWVNFDTIKWNDCGEGTLTGITGKMCTLCKKTIYDQTDKLTIEEVEWFVSDGRIQTETESLLAEQLLEVMRENERLRLALDFIDGHTMDEGTAKFARSILKPDCNKPTDNRDWNCEHGIGHKQCGSCYDQTEPPFVQGLGGKYQLPYTKTP